MESVLKVIELLYILQPLRSGVYFPPTVHLFPDEPHLKRSVATQGRWLRAGRRSLGQPHPA